MHSAKNFVGFSKSIVNQETPTPLFVDLNCCIQLYGHKALTNLKVANGDSSPEAYTDLEIL
ncbi:hypothetical protein T11_9137 [Trichinella zimbabwensis]|uniref:Uncharacterized protein n=1 Tax=Trichinella zimbabwensis TaxID=268475 RepID=A0A0V1GFH8_9BILA|nr:hypothetical protein T11_9137 [Trichinella zimbabwensis]